ncbi:hypothetical protein Dehly_1298 [Dehalogenimonas lykanthroporepellens BL-DC-9]|nr:hypothetical protein Dehly_1298 [Dehalogenimonas lykanthroporepellens BL-DC-9]
MVAAGQPVTGNDSNQKCDTYAQHDDGKHQEEYHSALLAEQFDEGLNFTRPQTGAGLVSVMAMTRSA